MEAAKKSRSLAKKAFNHQRKSLEEAVDNGVLCKTVEKRYEEFKGTWKIVQQRHEEFSSYLEDKEDEEDPWITELDTYYNDLEIKVDNYLESCAKSEREEEERKSRELAEKEEEKAKLKETALKDEEKRVKAENQMRSLTDLFIRRQQEGEKSQRSADHIMELLSETNKDKFEYMAEALKEAALILNKRMEICDRIQEKYISSLLTEQDKQKEKEWSLSIWETFDKLINDIKMFVAQHSPKVNIEDLNSKEKNLSSGVRLEKLQFQIFQGDVRKYPRFKAEFEKHVKPLCSSNQVAFVLKSYLSWRQR